LAFLYLYVSFQLFDRAFLHFSKIINVDKVLDCAWFYVPANTVKVRAYMGDGFYRSEDPTNGIKVLKEHIEYTINRKNTISRQTQNTANLLVYNNMG